MRRYVNLDTLEVQDRADFAQAIDAQEVKRGDNRQLEYQFVREGVPVDLNPDGEAITWTFGAKVEGDFDGSHVFKSTVFTKTNGTRFTDGVLNSTTTLTSATAVFTRADIGLVITGTGIPVDTTIVDVTNDTTIVLSTAATATSGGVTITIVARDTYYTVAPSFDTAKGNNLLGYDTEGFAETTEIRCTAGDDTAVGFRLSDDAGTVGVWVDLDNAGAVVPSQAAACARQIEITTITTGMTAAQKAAAIAAVLAADGAWASADVSGSLITLVDASVGTRTAAADFTDAQASGFGLRTWIAGSDPGTMDNQDEVDLDAEVEWVIGGKRTSTDTFTLRLQFDVNQGGEGSPINSYAAQRGSTAIGNGVDYLDIVFPSAFGAAPLIIGPTVQKADAADDNVACVAISTLTANGFRAHFNTATPNANYHLHWLAIPA